MPSAFPCIIVNRQSTAGTRVVSNESGAFAAKSFGFIAKTAHLPCVAQTYKEARQWHWNSHPKKETFPHYRKFETTLAGRPFVVETGKMCALSSGSCMVSYGDTRVLCNVTMSEKPREGIDFFPLSVDFEELSTLWAANSRQLYAPGEGRPGEKAILTVSASSTAPSARCSRKICATMWPW